jgi:hypothetical protein
MNTISDMLANRSISRKVSIKTFKYNDIGEYSFHSLFQYHCI